MADPFCDHFSDYLDGTYDCVDRIVINAYNPLTCSPAGFRTWWRILKGTDDDLDNSRLMRFAGRMSRRIRAYASKNKIPLIQTHAGQRKHEIAEEYLPKDPNFKGIFLILVGRAPAPVFDIQRSPNGKIVNIAHKKPYPYVNHFYFHFIDPEWGHMTIKMCSHPPFRAQIMLNGHEHVSRRARSKGVRFTQAGNCFTEISDTHRLSIVAETSFHSDGAIGRLTQVCECWIYSACLCFALDQHEQENTRFRYRYTVFQAEYSRNLLFSRGSQLDKVFNSIVDHTRAQLDLKILKTIFGTKKRPAWTQKRKKKPRMEVVVERPVYDLTVFKIHFGLLTAKLYTKGERVLRAESIIHNTKALRCRRSVENFSEIIALLQGVLNRFLEALSCINASCITESQLDELPMPSQVGKTRMGGIDINKERTRLAIQTLIVLSVNPHGFSSTQFAKEYNRQQQKGQEYTRRQAAYDIKKFRGKNLVRKIQRSNRYEAVPEGLKTATALLTIREKVIKPVLAGAVNPRPENDPKLNTQNTVNEHYKNMQREMIQLFHALKIIA